MSKRERRGILTLQLLFVLLWLGQWMLRGIFPAGEFPAEAALCEEIAAATTLAPKDRIANKSGDMQLSGFDPNTASRETLLELGLPPRTAGQLLRYREKGGKFRRKEDLRKLYSITEEEYKRLEPYIILRSQPAPGKMSGTQPGTVRMSPFDPNEANEETLLAWRLPAGVVRNILRYREKGGRFRTAEDLKHIYGMPEQVWKQIAVHIHIPQVQEAQGRVAELRSVSGAKAPDSLSAQLDINDASEAEWQYLPGIGPAYARKIVGFRKKLGGFCSIEQVGETYHLPDSVFTRIRAQLRLDTPWERLPVNSADAETLQAHPYISYKQARLIVNYRDQHGDYTGISSLERIKVLDSAWIARIAPYLDFNTP